jgi:hypothetical protein
VRARLLVVTVLALALVGLMSLDGASRSVATTATSLVSNGPVVPGDGATGSIWFCAAPSAGTSSAPVHEVLIANPTRHRVTATVTEVGAAQPATGTTTSAVPPPRRQPVPARSTLVLPATAPGASVQVELSAPGPVVSHRLTAGGLFDEAPCATSGSRTWYFPSVDTSSDADVARLWLFNPFPSDASVDVSVVSEEGARRPPALTGLVVPGGSNRVIALNDVAQLRAQVALDVRTRAGLVVAELTQVNGAPAGLRLTPGVAATRTRLAFADGVVGSGVGERYVLFNPTRRSASVLLQVVPHDADPDLLPEPFDLEVPARRFVVLDLDQQARVPTDRPHWVRLESVNGVGVAVQRSVRVVAKGSSIGLDSGFGSSTGSSVAATAWTTPWADRSAQGRSALVVVNPSVDTLAEVRIRTWAAGGPPSSGSAVRSVELGPGRGATVDLGVTGGQPGVLSVTSSSPVVVERRVLGGSRADLAVVAAVPLADSMGGLPSMSHTVAAGPSGS